MKHSGLFLRLAAAFFAALLSVSCGSGSPIHVDNLQTQTGSSLPSDIGQTSDSVILEQHPGADAASSLPATYLPASSGEEVTFPDDGKFYDIPNLIERHKTRLFGCPVKNWMDDVKDSAMQQIENLCALPFLSLWTQEFNDYWAEMVYCVEFSLCNRHLMM